MFVIGVQFYWKMALHLCACTIYGDKAFLFIPQHKTKNLDSFLVCESGRRFCFSISRYFCIFVTFDVAHIGKYVMVSISI